MARLSDFNVLSFDCYGTLIDWETGLLEALEPWLQGQQKELSKDEILETFARHESAQEMATPGMPYPEILARVHHLLAAEWGLYSSADDAALFGASVGDWLAFDDSAGALTYLRRYYKLVVLSNVDNKSIERSSDQLAVDFDWIFTAEDIGSYKPDPRNFVYMLDQLSAAQVPPEKILHTAQSVYHDHVPAKSLGLATNWIDRRHDREGWGATLAPDQEIETDFHYTSMADFVEHHRRELTD